MITIGISTVQSNRDGAVQLAAHLASFCDDVVLVVQMAERENVTRKSGVTIIQSVERGLSKSRNVIIENASGDYIWFLDDDVTVSEKDFVRLHNAISSSRSVFDFIFCQISCSDCSGFYKKYPGNSMFLSLKLLSVSSIEILARRSFLLSNSLYFNERLGLGTRMKSGEENELLLRALNSGASFKWLNFPAVSHPCFEAKTMAKSEYWGDVDILASKREVIRFLPSFLRCMVFLYWGGRIAFYARKFELFRFWISGRI